MTDPRKRSRPVETDRTFRRDVGDRSGPSHVIHHPSCAPLLDLELYKNPPPGRAVAPAYEWMMTDIARIIAFLKREYPLPQVDPVRSLLPLYNLIQADPLQAWVRDCVQALIDDGQGPTIDAVVCLHRPSYAS